MSASEILDTDGDEAAFSALYRAHHAKLLRYCQYRLRDRFEAEDVMQEAFARAWRTMPPSAYSDSFYPWLRVVAGNLCTDVLRKRSRSEPAADIETGMVDGGMDRVTEEEDRVLVRTAMLRLNDRHREALMMREGEGLSYDQIAERTGVTSGTVESLLWRARQALKREFTLVAGRTGAMAPIPVLAVAVRGAGRLRRRVTARITRRLPWLTRSVGDTPAGHVALATLAAMTMIGGIAATFGTGPSSRPTVVQPSADRRPALPAATGIVPAPAVPSITAVAGAAPAAPVPLPSPPPPPAGPAPKAAEAGRPAPLRLQDPLVVGSAPARYSHSAPVGLSLGSVAVGISPAETVTYAADAAGKVAPAPTQILSPHPTTPSR